MNKITKIAIFITLIAAVAVVIAVKQGNSTQEVKEGPISVLTTDMNERNLVMPQDDQHPVISQDDQPTVMPQGKGEAVAAALPKLLDLGATKCIPCKMMAPILEELKREYEGRLEVEFIDVWENPNEAKKYGIKLIPTQIFFDSSGKELFRHEGFFSREDILSKFAELKIELAEKAGQ